MEYYESRIKVNGEWRLLLIVKSTEPTEFGTNLIFDEPSRNILYTINGVYRQFEEDGFFIYWFLPIEKIIQSKEWQEETSSLKEILDAMLGVTE